MVPGHMKGTLASLINEKHSAPFERLFICPVHIIIHLVEIWKLTHDWECGRNTIDLFHEHDVANVNK
jgi:hypothetical protein